MIKFKKWFESTAPYIKKLVDPALLMAGELHKLLNPNCKQHPSSAYRFNVGSDSVNYGIKSKYPKLLQNRIINSVKFEFRVDKKDKTELQYVKTNADGEILRDESGGIIYYTKNELLQRFANSRYEYSVGVFVGDTYVGGIDDEWGCVLYRVADEYQGFGLGSILAKLAWEMQPGKTSGGFTDAGYETFLTWHRESVRKYLQTGMYSHLVKTGQIDVDRIKKIISSAKGAESTKDSSFYKLPPKKKYERNLNSDDPKDYMLMEYEGSFIIYDKKLKDIEDGDYYWENQMIKAAIYAVDKRIKLFGGDTKELKEIILILGLATSDEQSLYVEPEDIQFVDENIITIGPKSTIAGYQSHLVSLKKRIDMTQFKQLISKERKFRKLFDTYKEFQSKVIEMAYSKFQS